MPSRLRKRLSALGRYISTGENPNDSNTSPKAKLIHGKSFIARYLDGEFVRSEVAVHHGRDAGQLPEVRVVIARPFSPANIVVAAHTGPDGGLTSIGRSTVSDAAGDSSTPIDFIDGDSDENGPGHVTNIASLSPCNSIDGRCWRERVSSLHYARRRLTGTLSLPDWVPASPELPYDRLRHQPVSLTAEIERATNSAGSGSPVCSHFAAKSGHDSGHHLSASCSVVKACPASSDDGVKIYVTATCAESNHLPPLVLADHNGNVRSPCVCADTVSNTERSATLQIVETANDCALPHLVEPASALSSVGPDLDDFPRCAVQSHAFRSPAITVSLVDDGPLSSSSRRNSSCDMSAAAALSPTSTPAVVPNSSAVPATPATSPVVVSQESTAPSTSSDRHRLSEGRACCVGLPAQYERYLVTDRRLVDCCSDEMASVTNWNRGSARAFGASISLYERHPHTRKHSGEPIADVFGVVARADSAVLALADGVNWGNGSRLAARSAVHGCLDYLNRALFGPAANNTAHTTTNDVFVTLLRSFHSAHGVILQQQGLLTTLTAAVVLPCATVHNIHNKSPENRPKYVVCVCNVGDTLAYVFSRRHGVREITKGSHDIYSVRDMRDALGALGPVTGRNPELNNLTLSMTQIDTDDIVFLTSDGVSDNFDPVVGKFVLDKQTSGAAPSMTRAASEAPSRGPPGGLPRRPLSALVKTPPWARHAFNTAVCNLRPSSASIQRTGGNVQRRRRQLSVPVERAACVDPCQRHELTLLRMEDVIRYGTLPDDAAGDTGQDAGSVKDARHLCCRLLDFAVRLTNAKRRLLEDKQLYVTRVRDSNGDWQSVSREDQRTRRRQVCQRLSCLPGKLDHATVVAYQVGRITPPSPVETAL